MLRFLNGISEAQIEARWPNEVCIFSALFNLVGWASTRGLALQPPCHISNLMVLQLYSNRRVYSVRAPGPLD